MNWFVEFLNLTAGHWDGEAARFDAQSNVALADGNLWDAAHNAGAASSCRQIARSYRRCEHALQAEPPNSDVAVATEDYEYDCTIADLVDLTSGEALQ